MPALLLVGALTTGCVLPAPTSGAFESKAAQSAASALGTMRFEAWTRDRVITRIPGSR
jgi:hypothetical protein